MIVVDATVWVDHLLGVLPASRAELIRTEACVSPPHVDFEVGSALMRLARRGTISSDAAQRLIGAFSRHPVARHRDPADAHRATELLDNASYADAWYLALAERLGLGVLTTDGGMREAADVNGIPVIS